MVPHLPGFHLGWDRVAPDHIQAPARLWPLLSERGDEKVFSTVLFEGAVHPFLYVEIAVWDEDEPAVGDDHDQLGLFCGLWLPWRLSNLPGGEKLLTIPKSTPSGEVLIFLRLRLL